MSSILQDNTKLIKFFDKETLFFNKRPNVC